MTDYVQNTNYVRLGLLAPFSNLTFYLFNPLVPNWYYCTYILILVLVLSSIRRKKLTLTLLTNKTPKPTILIIERNHFLYSLNH